MPVAYYQVENQKAENETAARNNTAFAWKQAA